MVRLLADMLFTTRINYADTPSLYSEHIILRHFNTANQSSQNANQSSQNANIVAYLCPALNVPRVRHKDIFINKSFRQIFLLP
jgi:hypothetical protein